MPGGKPKAIQPELTVAAVFEQHGRFLLVEESVGGRTVINQPAGHVEHGESLTAAVARETLEETAWQFVPESIVGVYLWSPGPGRNPLLRVAFSGHCIGHDPRRALDAGIERVVWLNRSELATRQSTLRSPMVLRAVDDYLNGPRHGLELFQQVEPSELALRAAIL